MFNPRIQKAAQDLAEAVSVSQQGALGAPPPPTGPQGPGGPLTAPGTPPEAPQGPPGGQLGLGPNQSPSPLQAVPSFKSAPVEAYLQKAEGQKGASQRPGGSGDVGFRDGGRVRFAVRM